MKMCFDLERLVMEHTELGEQLESSLPLLHTRDEDYEDLQVYLVVLSDMTPESKLFDEARCVLWTVAGV